MAGTSLKRKYARDDEWDSEMEYPDSDPMDIDDDEDEGIVSRHPTTRAGRVLRSRDTARRNPVIQSIGSDEDDSDVAETSSSRPRRNLRKRRAQPQQQQLSLYGISTKSSQAEMEQDELANEPQMPSDREDGDFLPVVSDLAVKRTRRTGAVQRSRRLHAQRARSRAQLRATNRRGSDDSDIEFEQPRRSSRATRNMVDMRDEALMDDDSFYVVDDKAAAGPKVVSVREIFQPVPPESGFSRVHIVNCHNCGGSKQRGQIVHCQGCSLSYHKHCLGFRSARDHVVTKVGDEYFVLQCRFCIDVYSSKDKNAPKHSTCQLCKDGGQACAPFSKKKTARQEEKLREENGGTDPTTPVSPNLLNNPDIVLFRCVTCHRGWHLDHLPRTGSEPIGTDIKAERLKDYMVDWQCNECTSVKHKIHRLVAWRPLQDPACHPSFEDVSDDGKEYLIKWETMSYFHCTWMPGAWVFGTAAGAMRTSFGKRASQLDLLKPTEKEAIPDEYLMADIVFNVKMNAGVSRYKSKESDLANVANVNKVLVKFQGLGYDDVVWDSPPGKDMGEFYTAFEDSYLEYVEGKYFHNEPHSRIRDRIKSFKASELEQVDAQPAGIKRGKLMGYQVEGLNWLLGNYHEGRSVVLADEMGLGKTVQVVSLVTSLVQDEPKCWPFLVVVPNATCANWRREFKQWAPDLRVVTYHGGKESQDLAYKYELFPNGSTDMKAHVVIMSYDSAQDPRTSALFKPVHWVGLVVDEGQRLKNDRNLLYLALRAMRIPFRLLLTGTPLQNNKRELFNLLQFIDETQDAASLDAEYAVLDKETLPKLHEEIRPYFLRRTKAGVLKFLPPMAQIILPVTMTVIQEKLSKSIMAKNPQLIKTMFANDKISRKDRSSLNNILMQLRKCLCHPFMYSEAIEERHHDPSVLHQNLVEASAKLLLLEIMLPKLQERGHRVLIFSQFLQQLDILEDFLGGMGCQFRRLDGAMSSLEKQRRIDAFNAPDSPVFAFLLSTRAGGVGINLATADTVIIMDPDFNPHQDIQALSRAHRIGQKKKVLCFQLMTKDSVEERIMQVGRKKMALDHALIESMDDDDLAGDDLESILKHGAQALFSDDYQKTAIHYDGPSVDKLLDRSQMEQTKADEEGSAETQFSYARVWANEKYGFNEGLDAVEDKAPEPITSSVWDKILAEREEEARRKAEANKEVLGRGGRRRNAINYKANALENIPVPEGIEPESSDSSEFAGADESPDESEDEDQAAKDGEVEDTTTSNPPNPVPKAVPKVGAKVDAPKAKPAKPEAKRQSNSEAKPASNPEAKPAAKETKRTQPQQIPFFSYQDLFQGTVTAQYRNGPPQAQARGTIPGGPSNPPFQPNGYAPGYGVNGNLASGVPSHYRNAGGRGGQSQPYQSMNLPTGPLRIPQPRPPLTPAWYTDGMVPVPRNMPHTYTGHNLSEAQLRLAIDDVWHSSSNASTKQQRISTLLHQLRLLGMQNGTQQR
ncbi:Chromatin remodeling factor mit1 [Tolypocladium paradoxum]|uniref:Chromatin remodeling factor mit1 n=1 Tax=Tolypocladium paradoxum TaxID=94208 RepID=A0A2S4L9C9_9HYPO|nr:Chromatin remodeling factor mit1 [Tolypocladium paradoxum]